MNTTRDIASITVLVTYPHNNELLNDIIYFKVYEHEGQYIAIPLVGDAHRRKMNLPERLAFQVVQNRILSGNIQNHDVVSNIVSELRMLQIV
jgi:hypothetical protein